MKQRVEVAWMKWRDILGVMCDKRMPQKLKCKICRRAIRPVLLYGAECRIIRKKEENFLRRTETLTDDLKTLQNWLNSNELSLNAIKTKCMFIASRQKIKYYPKKT